MGHLYHMHTHHKAQGASRSAEGWEGVLGNAECMGCAMVTAPECLTQDHSSMDGGAKEELLAVDGCQGKSHLL